MLSSSPLCFSNNRCRLMKTKHFTLKAFTASAHLSDIRSVMQVCILRYQRVTVGVNVGVKTSVSVCNSHFSSAQRVSDKANWTERAEQWMWLMRKSAFFIPKSTSCWEMPFTVVILPQAPLLLRLLWSTFPKWKVKMNVAPFNWSCDAGYHTCDFVCKC